MAAKVQTSGKVLEWIKMGMFPGFIMFSVGNTYEEIIKRLDKLPSGAEWKLGLSEDAEKLNGESGHIHAMKRGTVNTKTGEQKTYFYIIFLKQVPLNDLTFVQVAHEVLHICQFFLPDVLDRNKEYECEAYLHSFLMEHCIDKLRKSIKPTIKR
jgi:hypothetical protein